MANIRSILYGDEIRHMKLPQRPPFDACITYVWTLSEAETFLDCLLNMVYVHCMDNQNLKSTTSQNSNFQFLYMQVIMATKQLHV